jgi:hypothetical protein
MDTDLWTYNESLDRTQRVDGWSVEALDGGIGKIDEATYDVGASYIVVDTGPWIFGRKVLIPAKAIARLDVPAQTVYLRLKQEQVKDAPAFDDTADASRQRDALDAYYGPIF